MDIRKLRAFCAIVEKGSFRRAADLLDISQPSVSQHIATLEKDYGVKLFQREGRGVNLTSEGHALYTLCRELIKLCDAIPATFNELKTLGKGNLSMGATPHIAEKILPQILEAFCRSYPGLHVTVRTGNPGLLERLLREGSLELGIMGATPQVQDRFDYVVRTLSKEQLVLIVPKGDEMENRIVEPASLRNVPFLRYVSDHPLSRVLGDYFLRRQIEMTSQIEVDSIHQAVSLVGTGKYCAIVERSALDVDPKHLQVGEAFLEDLEKIQWEIQVSYPKALGLSFAGWEMVRHLERAIGHDVSSANCDKCTVAGMPVRKSIAMSGTQRRVFSDSRQFWRC